MAFTLPELPYAKDALEPHIDAKTMEIHHDKHHAAYVTNLNAALAGNEWEGKTIEELMANIKDAVALYFEGENLAELGFIPKPSVVINFETPAPVHGVVKA